MFPYTFSIDTNKDMVIWKAMMKIPPIGPDDFELYLNEIKKIGITNEKNILN